MTNTELLNAKIKGSGYRIYWIAEQLGLTYQGLRNKIYNKNLFTAVEINAFKKLLKLTPEDVDRIFFAE